MQWEGYAGVGSAEPVQLESPGGEPNPSDVGLKVLSTLNYTKLQRVIKVSHQPHSDPCTKVIRQRACGLGTLT